MAGRLVGSVRAGWWSSNSSVVDELPTSGDISAWTVPAGDLALEAGSAMSAGFVLLGAYAAITGLVSLDALIAAMRELVPPYRTQHLAVNEAALRAGAGAVPGPRRGAGLGVGGA